MAIEDLFGDLEDEGLFTDLPPAPDTLGILGGEETSPEQQNAQFDMFDGPIPGASLTTEPGSMPYERPPQFTDETEAMDFLFQRFTESKNYKNVMRTMDAGMPIALIAQHTIMFGASEGMWNTDMTLLLLEPTMMMLGTLAFNGGITPTWTMPEKEDAGVNPEPIRKAFERVKEVSEENKDMSTQEVAEQEKKAEEVSKSLLGTPPEGAA